MTKSRELLESMNNNEIIKNKGLQMIVCTDRDNREFECIASVPGEENPTITTWNIDQAESIVKHHDVRNWSFYGYRIYCPLCGQEFILKADQLKADDCHPNEWTWEGNITAVEEYFGHNCQ